MQRNVAGQSVTLYAVDASTGLPKTGDSANMVYYVSKDDGTVTAIASASGVPTEVDATNAKGSYKIALSQAETNGDKLLFTGKSSTSNVVVVPQTIYTVPAGFSGLSIASNKVAATLGSGDYSGNTVQTGDGFARLGAAGAGLTALGDARVANLDAAVSTRMATFTLPTNFASLSIDSSGRTTVITYVGNTPQTGDSYAIVNSGSFGNSALLSAVQNVQNNTFIASSIPQFLDTPLSGSVTINVSFVFSDETGAAKNLDSGNPTVTLVNDAGTDRSSRLGAFSNPATGKYVVAYTSTSADTLEGLHWDVTGTINSKLRRLVAYTQVVNTIAVDFTSADRTTLNAIASGVRLADGVAHGGSTATLTLQSATLNNPAGPGLSIANSSGGSPAYAVYLNAADAGIGTSTDSGYAIVGSLNGGISGDVGGNVVGKVLGGGAGSFAGIGVQADIEQLGGTSDQIPSMAAFFGVINPANGWGLVDVQAVAGRAAHAAGAVTFPGTLAATGDAMTLTGGERNAVADAYLDRANAIETGVTPRQAERLILAGAAGKSAGFTAGAGTGTFRNAVADTKPRITAVVDGSGNRTAITWDAT